MILGSRQRLAASAWVRAFSNSGPGLPRTKSKLFTDQAEDNFVRSLMYEMEIMHREAAAETVPWFVKNMPDAYFSNIDPELQKDHLRAVTALVMSSGQSSTREKNDKLVQAAAAGDIRALKTLLAAGANPNAGDYDQRTAWHLAASNGQLLSLRTMFNASEAKPNINVQDRWGHTPLFDARHNDHGECAQWLEGKGGVVEADGLAAAEVVEENGNGHGDAVNDLVITSRNGKFVTFFKPNFNSSEIGTMLRQLPSDQPLARIKSFTAQDGSMHLIVFEMGELPYPHVREVDANNPHLDESYRAIYTYAEELKAGKYEGQAGHTSWQSCFEPENLARMMRNCSYMYLDNVIPKRFLRQMSMVDEIQSKQSEAMLCQVHRDETRQEVDMVVECVAPNFEPSAMLYQVARYLSVKGISIKRCHIDNIKWDDRYTTVAPEERPLTMLRLLCDFKDENGESVELTPRFIEMLQRNIQRLKWIDESVMEWLEENPEMSLRKAEVIQALMAMSYRALNIEHPNVYTVGRMNDIVREPEHSKVVCAVAGLFHDKFFPGASDKGITKLSKGQVKPADTEEWRAKYQEVKEMISRQVQGSVAQDCLSKLLEAVDSSLRTNLFLNKRYGLGIRVDPRFMIAKGEEKEVPYGVFFIYSRRVVGFHIRFRDIARGGLRLIPVDGNNRFNSELGRVFDENYGLAYAQQLKNKDIPEGGSKGTCLVNIGNLTATHRNAHWVMRKAVKSWSDTILDLISPDPKTDGLLIDYYGKPELLYIGPDENILPEDIEWMTHRAARRYMVHPNAFMSSKPKAGINHKVYGVTSEGVNVFLGVALKAKGIDPHEQPFTIKITGGTNGDVAGNMVRFLKRDWKDPKIVGMCDHTCSLEDPNGLDIDELFRLHEEDLPLDQYARDKFASSTELHSVDTPEGVNMRNTMHNRLKADVFIPGGGRPNTINETNWKEFLNEDGTPSSDMIVEAANIFTTPGARELLTNAGVTFVKDSSANKAGVCCSSYEIVSSMLLSEEEFMASKEELVRDVLVKLRDSARTEAELLFRHHAMNPGDHLWKFSSQVSDAIMRATDAISAVLGQQEDGMSDELKDRLVLQSIPAKLGELAGDKIRELPMPYFQAIIAARLASKMVYNEGVQYVNALPEQAIMDFARQYIDAEEKMEQLMESVSGTDLEGKEQLLSILKHAGIRSAIELKMANE